MGGVLALGGADHADERIVQFEFAGAGPGEGKDVTRRPSATIASSRTGVGSSPAWAWTGRCVIAVVPPASRESAPRRSQGSAVDTGGGGAGQSSRETIDPGGGARWFGSAHDNSSSNTVSVRTHHTASLDRTDLQGSGNVLRLETKWLGASLSNQ